jgi:hypothetical protein
VAQDLVRFAPALDFSSASNMDLHHLCSSLTESALVSGNTDIRVSFAHDVSMFQGMSNRKQFVVTCKQCRREVPSGAKEFPFHSIAVTCSLCGEQRQYLPSEIMLGKPHHPETK